jgi:uncharacterized membrane protein YhaH (DUF805 family)
MESDFTKKVRDAAIAGWWTLAIFIVFLSVVWFVYLAILSAKPSWLLALCGPDISWSTIQSGVFWGVAVLKIWFYVMATVVVWLSLWARRLGRK